jgi:RNA polymerase sigma-70 factor (ECF subfamily)
MELGGRAGGSTPAARTRRLADRGKDPASPAGLDAWVLATAGDAVAYAASLLRDRTAAEDVVQDCYCRLLQKAGEYDLLRDGRKLLFAAVTNACFNRNSRTRPVVSLDAAGTDGQGLHAVLADRGSATPEQAVLRKELEQEVGEALQRLPVPQRAALEMKSLGHSLQDIGAALGISPGHAGVLVYRARQAMAKYLAPYLEEQPR